jgi:hypothetical protein
MPATITIQMTVDAIRVRPSVTKVMGNALPGVGSNAIAIKISNKVLQEFLQEGMPWKWNRRKPTAFALNALQQDYCTSITDVGWLEYGDRISISTSMTTPPAPPLYPVRAIEAVRELQQTSVQGTPQQISWVPNSEAICGAWVPNALYTDPAACMQNPNPQTGQQLPNQPLMQIRDSNGNIQVLTQFGTTGATPPTWNTVANQVTNDGTAQWTMADPNGIAWRVSPLPPQNGNPFLIQPYYQKKPPTITGITQPWTIPDELSNVYEVGFLAYVWEAAEDDKKFAQTYALFQSLIKKSLKSGDRERESYGMYPGRSLNGATGSLQRGDSQYPPGLFSN